MEKGAGGRCSAACCSVVHLCDLVLAHSFFDLDAEWCLAHRVVLCCIVVCCVVLCRAVPCCAVLCCAVLCCAKALLLLPEGKGRDIYSRVQVNGRVVCVTCALCASVFSAVESGNRETWRLPTRPQCTHAQGP